MRVKIVLLIGFGFLFLGLGLIGLLLPVWPTTPFVLISATCFSRTPHLRARIMRISYFREHIENYENRAGLSHKTVMISLSYLWGMLLLSMILIQTLWISLLLIVIGIAVTIHILWMSKPKQKWKEFGK